MVDWLPSVAKEHAFLCWRSIEVCRELFSVPRQLLLLRSLWDWASEVVNSYRVTLGTFMCPSVSKDIASRRDKLSSSFVAYRFYYSLINHSLIYVFFNFACFSTFHWKGGNFILPFWKQCINSVFAFVEFVRLFLFKKYGTTFKIHLSPINLSYVCWIFCYFGFTFYFLSHSLSI